MSTRRGHNEGSIRKRADGRWEGIVSLPTGDRKSFYAKTRQEVQRKLHAALQNIERGLPIVGELQTVEQYLTSWLEIVKPSLVLETWEGYAQSVNIHIIPELGALRLSQLSAQRVQSLYAKLLATDLSPTTIRRIHAVLHRALEQAMRLELVARNVPPGRAAKMILDLMARGATGVQLTALSNDVQRDVAAGLRPDMALDLRGRGIMSLLPPSPSSVLTQPRK